MGFRYDYVSMYIFEHGPMRYTCYECLLQLDDFSTYKAIHDFISLRIVVDVIFFSFFFFCNCLNQVFRRILK